jgi:hypothetical protein
MTAQEEFLHDHIDEIMDHIVSGPRHWWFYARPTENRGIQFSEYLTQSTGLNPENWERGEWILKFVCQPHLDLDDDGDEYQLHLWLTENIEQFIRYPRGK